MTYIKFTVITYPGVAEPPICRWFYSQNPVEWVEARDRLIKAGILDPNLAGRTYMSGGWMLSVDLTSYSDERAEPLP